MNRRATIGIDVGTTTVKAVVADDDLRVVGRGSSAVLNMRTDQSGRSEESADQILDCVTEAVAAALANAPVDVEPTALAVASQSGSIVGLDTDGSPTGPLITWMDVRSSGIVQGWLRSDTAEAIRAVSGWNPGTGLGLSTLAWIHARQSRYPQVAKWGGADTLVTAFLTGTVATNPSNAAAMQLLDATGGGWSPYLCGLAGVAPDRLPTLIPSGAIMGRITDSAAARCRLPVDLPVVSGGHDQTCAAFALDVVEPGNVLLGAGTAWVITTVAKPSDYRAIPVRYNVSRHVVPDRLTASEYIGGMGADYETWVSRTHDHSGGPDTSRAAMFARVESDIRADNPRGRQAREIMRRSAELVRDSLEHLGESGIKPTRMTLTGGAATSETWPDLIADTTGLPVSIPGDNSWPAMGAARLAGQGISLHHRHLQQTQENTK